MQFRYVTVTDRHAFYETSGSIDPNEVTDATERVYFEAVARSQDQICLESDVNAAIKFSSNYLVPDSIVTGLAMEESPDGAGVWTYNGSFPTDADVDYFSSKFAQEVTTGMTGSYAAQHFISSEDPLTPEPGFELSKNKLRWRNIGDGVWLPLNRFHSHEWYGLEWLYPPWSDWHFSHLPNYSFLPPINKLPEGVSYRDVYPWIKTGINYNITNLSYEGWRQTVEPILGQLEESQIFDTVQTKDGPRMVASDITSNPNVASMIEGAQLGSSGVLGNSMMFTENMLWSGMIDEELHLKIDAMFPADSFYHQMSTLMKRLVLPLVFVKGLRMEDFAAAKSCFLGNYAQDNYIKHASLAYATNNFEQFASQLLSNHSTRVKHIEFEKTSRDNNIIVQLFEYTQPGFSAEMQSLVKKLTCIDAGSMPVNGDAQNSSVDLYYVGKLYSDPETDELKFGKIFTIIMSDNELSQWSDII
tara:strand:- start:11859 stop:13274 length:1416 start_codon:yes stop_codon:yes gene_type:complete